MRSSAKNVVIFIDSNIFLDFYRNHKSGYDELIKVIDKIKARLVITTQVRDEVMRRKLSVALEHLNDVQKQLSDEKPTLPIIDHFHDSDVNSDILDWNGKRISIEKQYKQLSSRLKEIIYDFTKTISASNDPISKKLASLFADPIDSSLNYNKAIMRRDLGNPPGKGRHTIGDEINWETILAYISATRVDELWIVSRDGDYGVQNNGKVVLNPLLYEDVKRNSLNDGIIVEVYFKLIDMIQYFSSQFPEEIEVEIKGLDFQVLSELENERTDWEMRERDSDIAARDRSSSDSLQNVIRMIDERNKSMMIGSMPVALSRMNSFASSLAIARSVLPNAAMMNLMEQQNRLGAIFKKYSATGFIPMSKILSSQIGKSSPNLNIQDSDTSRKDSGD